MMAPSGRHFASSMFAVVLAVLAIIISEQSTSAQLVGTDICACQPSVYTFKLNFSLSCIDTTVEGPGITETACNVNSRDSNENVTNPFPITVSEVQVLELGQNLQVVGSSVFGGTFFDGDEISYTSITVTEPGTINEATIPRGFQVFITGINSEEDPLVNQWAITYNNDCGIFPLLEIGDLIGWSNFTYLGKPAEEFCPIAGPDTAAPVVAVTEAPTFPPPTQAPVVGESKAPAVAETESPKSAGPPTCPPYESYESEDDESGGSASRDSKGGSSKSGGSAGSRKIGRGSSASKTSKSGKSANGVAGHTESVDSKSSGTASKQRRWLGTGGGNCPEPPASYPSSSKGGGSAAKGGSGSKTGSATTMSEGSVVSKGSSKAASTKESTSEEDMAMSKTESESESTSSKTEKKTRRLRQP